MRIVESGSEQDCENGETVYKGSGRATTFSSDEKGICIYAYRTSKDPQNAGTISDGVCEARPKSRPGCHFSNAEISYFFGDSESVKKVCGKIISEEGHLATKEICEECFLE